MLVFFLCKSCQDFCRPFILIFSSCFVLFVFSKNKTSNAEWHTDQSYSAVCPSPGWSLRHGGWQLYTRSPTGPGSGWQVQLPTTPHSKSHTPATARACQRPARLRRCQSLFHPSWQGICEPLLRSSLSNFTPNPSTKHLWPSFHFVRELIMCRLPAKINS